MVNQYGLMQHLKSKKKKIIADMFVFPSQQKH